MTQTITAHTNSVDAVWHALTDGKFILRHDGRDDTFCDVLDDAGNVIGSAHRIYSDGYAVQTRPFGGYVSDKQIVFVS